MKQLKKIFLAILMAGISTGAIAAHDTLAPGIRAEVPKTDTGNQIHYTYPADANGNTKLGITQSLNLWDAVTMGLVEGMTGVAKFGSAPDVDSGDGIVLVWGGTGVGIKTEPGTSTTADIDSISSSNAGDTQVWRIEGLDTNWNEVTQTVTLSGQTRVALTTALIRVNRAINTGATSNAGNVYIYVNGAITAGVPDTAVDTRAVVNIGNNQSQVAYYSVPAGKTAFPQRVWAAINKQGNVACTTFLEIRDFGSVFRIRNQRSIHTQGSTGYSVPVRINGGIAEKSDIAMFANASADNAGVSAGFDLILIENTLLP